MLYTLIVLIFAHDFPIPTSISLREIVSAPPSFQVYGVQFHPESAGRRLRKGGRGIVAILWHIYISKYIYIYIDRYIYIYIFIYIYIYISIYLCIYIYMYIYNIPAGI